MKNAIVLAAGKGTRMHSDLPKVLHKVCDMPMVEMIVRNLKLAGAERIVVVTGYGKEQVMQVMDGQCEFAVQEPQLGTGHAVMQAKQLSDEKGLTLVVNGDAPTIQPSTLRMLYDSVTDADMAVLTVSLENPSAYGRVIRDARENVEKIVEYKDCTKEQAAVHEINTGIYAFNNEKLFEGLKELKNNNAQSEYYITDLVEIFRSKGWSVKAVLAKDIGEVQGVNDCKELANANAWLKEKVNQKWMKEGIQFVDPSASYVGPYVTIGHDTVLYPNTYIYGDSVIEEGCTVYPGVFLKDCVVKANTEVLPGIYRNQTIK